MACSEEKLGNLELKANVESDRPSVDAIANDRSETGLVETGCDRD